MKYRLAAGSAPAVVLVPLLICLGTSMTFAQAESCPMAAAEISEQSARVQSADDSVQELMKEFDQRIRQLREEMQKRLNRALSEESRANQKLRSAEARIAELEQQASRLNDMVAQLRRQMGTGASPGGRPSSGIEIVPAPPETPSQPSGDGAFLGVQLEAVDAAAAQEWGLESGTGIGVVTTVPRAPAALVGMQGGDVITHVGGKAVGRPGFSQALQSKKPGDSVKIRYARMVDGAPVKFTATVTLAKRSDFIPGDGGAGRVTPTPTEPRRVEPAPARPAPVQPAPTDSVKLGATILDRGNGELEVTAVTDGSNAAVVGVQEGDFLLRMGGKRVRTIEDIKEFLGSTTPGQQRAIRFRRGSSRFTVQLRWGAGRMAPVVVSKEESGSRAPKPETRQPGVLGITIDETENGLVVAEVVDNSSAQQMGIKAKDRLLELNGTEATNVEALRVAFGKLYAGDTITAIVMRGGIRYTLSGKLKAAPSEAGGGGGNDASADDSGASRPAAAEQAVVPADRPRVGIEVEERAGRLTVVAIDADGAAAAAGMKVGDRLVSLGGRSVKRLEQIGSILAEHRAGGPLAASILRDTGAVEIDLRLAGVGE